MTMVDDGTLISVGGYQPSTLLYMKSTFMFDVRKRTWSAGPKLINYRLLLR
jgi:hypothetical protein